MWPVKVFADALVPNQCCQLNVNAVFPGIGIAIMKLMGAERANCYLDYNPDAIYVDVAKVLTSVLDDNAYCHGWYAMYSSVTDDVSWCQLMY